MNLLPQIQGKILYVKEQPSLEMFSILRELYDKKESKKRMSKNIDLILKSIKPTDTVIHPAAQQISKDWLIEHKMKIQNFIQKQKTQIGVYFVWKQELYFLADPV